MVVFYCFELSHVIFFKLRMKELLAKLSKFTKWQLFLKFRHYEKATKFEKISHLFWQISCFYSVASKQVGYFFKFLWPSQKSWTLIKSSTVKLGDKEPFPIWPIVNLLHKDKEHLALRNNFRMTKKFLITKFDCTDITLCWVTSKKNPVSFQS